MDHYIVIICEQRLREATKIRQYIIISHFIDKYHELTEINTTTASTIQ